MVMVLNPRELSWDDVDPARHPFEHGNAADVVAALEPARHVPPARKDVCRDHLSWPEWGQVAGPWTDAVTVALADQLGPWTSGWRWAQGEGDVDGGPITAWCCPGHSITDQKATLARVAAALVEWREWLEELADAFEVGPPDPEDPAAGRELWRAAVRDLIGRIAVRTRCRSGWYDHAERVLTWFLERWGVAPALARDLVDEAIGGRFESWTDPEPAAVSEVAERLARSVPSNGAASPADDPPDHLGRWLDVREQVSWAEVAEVDATHPRRRLRDAVADHIRAFDAVIDPARGRGLLAALDLARTDAAAGAVLDFALLQRWQEQVLGIPCPAFRTGPAFAKGGRERYGLDPGTTARFDTCLRQSATDPARPLPLAARAARAHLDVCFFHPFEDGNARAALLTAVFVLAREGVDLKRVDSVRSLSVDAGNAGDARWLADRIAGLVADA